MGMFLRLKGENAIGQYRLFIYHYQRIKRHKWWNFVSSRDKRIEQAKHDWVEGRFAPVPQETEFIPLPKEPPYRAES